MAASVVRGGAPIEAISARPIALLIGSEAHGLSEEAIEAADYSVTIDLVGETESLNAAVAAGILIHEFSKGPGLTPPGV